MAYEHWITPGTYDGNPSSEGNQPVPPREDDPFRAGDRIQCIKTWHPATREYRGQYEGEIYTVRAYLRDYDYLILEEYENGVVNMERFERI